MIYIISGASRSGKSIVTKTLLEQYHLPFVPVDSIMMGFMHGVKSVHVHDKMWPDEIAVKLWPFLETFIISIMYSDMDYVLDGEAFLPKHIANLIATYPDKIKAVFMGYTQTDVAKKLEEIRTYKSDNDWLNCESDEFVVEHIKNMLLYSTKIKKECSKYGIKYVDVSTDFEDSIHHVIEYLLY